MDSPAVVRTASGPLSGHVDNDVFVYRGIPFAAPPVGAFRFAAPQAPTSWDGVRDATRFGPPPPQPGRETSGDDWLTLAIWTSDPAPVNLPVVVWISGGGNLRCDTADPYLTGATIAAAGAVFVSINYRTGFEGFARIGGAPDNRVLLDQVAALRWVQENIAGFGGDPAKVTVLGQSAGAESIAALLTMPAAKGLFHRAVLQSLPGTYFAPELADAIAAEICRPLGIAPVYDELVAVAPAALVAASDVVTQRLQDGVDDWGGVAYSSTPFAPVVDGETLPSAPWAALATGAARDVPLLISHTRDEYRLLAAGLPPAENAQVDAVIDCLSPTPGVAAYRAALPTLRPDERREIALADWLYRMPSLHLAEAALHGGHQVWFSELSWGFGPQGASHGLDTLLMFDTADVACEVTAAGADVRAEADRLSATMRAELLAFVATGDPGWPSFSCPERMTRLYASTPGVGPYPDETSRTLWRTCRFDALRTV